MADAYVQGSPKGGGAWSYALGYEHPAQAGLPLNRGELPDIGDAVVTETAVNYQPALDRVVSNRLKIGITFLPVVFAWFVLRRGYPRSVRVFSFGWLLLCAVLFFSAPWQDADAPTPAATLTQSIKSSPVIVEAPYTRELPLVVSSGSSNRRPLSSDAKKLRSLWSELEGFRYDPKFHALGFDNPFQYGEWRGKVRQLDGRAGGSLFAEIGIAPGELLDLGNEYLNNKGLRSERSDFVAARLGGAFNPETARNGEGRILRSSEGCVDFALLARSLREQELSDFQASNASLDGAECVSLPAGAIVSGPTQRRAYEFLKEKGQYVFVLVRSQGRDLWVPEDEMSFKDR